MSIIKKIDKGTMVRTVLLALGLMNAMLTIAGKNPLPFSDQEVADFVSMVWVGAAAIWAWWKNNSFSDEAVLADMYKDQLKAMTVLERTQAVPHIFEEDDEEPDEEEENGDKGADQ